jgi:putative ABC transport system permease protein
MKILYLVFPNLSRRLLRTSLSVFTAFIAAFLLTILVSVPASISRITSDAENKLRVIVTAPNAYMLPIWYRDAIRKMPGVVAASAELQWGATYQDPREPIVAFGVDPDIVKVYPEGNVTAEETQQLLRNRNAAMVGSVLMARYHWSLGKPITLKNRDGKMNLTFLPIAILQAKRDQNSFVFRRELLDEGIKKAYDFDLSDQATFIAVRVDSIADVPKVIDEIDGRFHNSEYETSTVTQSDAIANGLSAIADLSTIIFSLCTVVVITVLLIAANSTTINVRERISEVAAIRCLGFQRIHIAALLFGEVAVMALIGGGAGAALALVLFGNGITLGAILGGMGYMQVTSGAALAGIFAILVVSLLSAIIPVLQAVAVSPAIALRKVV